MRYLGGMCGTGDLTRGEVKAGRAEYDFDGYLVKAGQVVCSGEIRASPEVLRDVFGRPDLRLRTDDGRLLSLRFSGRQLPAATDRAHVDVGGDLPSVDEWNQ